MSEELLTQAIAIVVAGTEAVGAVVIAVGAAWAAARFVAATVRGRNAAVFTPIRLSLGRYLTLGLEFLLAADVLRTAVAPSFQEIGQLAAIAAIRTGLNFFLGREIREEQAQVVARDAGDDRSPPIGPAPR
ncbi:MAG TPA: DUF1622 domain-containing protein [Micromonosporaceae bacterium]